MDGSVTIGHLSALSLERFVQILGAIYEESPWVAERAFSARPFADRNALGLAMEQAVRDATPAEQRALIAAHPSLGIARSMSAHSELEQREAGLMAASAQQRERLARLNDAYESRFGLPFVIAVGGLGIDDIIAACGDRLGNDSAVEFSESLRQIYRIAALRLAATVAEY